MFGGGVEVCAVSVAISVEDPGHDGHDVSVFLLVDLAVALISCHSSPHPRVHKHTHKDTMRLHQCLLLLFALLSPLVQASILAIDYGAEFTKLSLVKPGVPFDVLLDRDAKRKISSVVGWKKNDRVFGAEGKMSVSS